MDRLTEKTIGSFKYDLKNFKHKPKEFNDYDAFYAYSNAVKRLGEYEDTNLSPEDFVERNLRYRDMLQRLQFLENTTNIGGAIYKFCPICGNANIQGHKKDCELVKLLK